MTSEQLKYPSTQTAYLDWDFNEVWKHDSGSSVNNGYPYLRHSPVDILPPQEEDVRTMPPQVTSDLRKPWHISFSCAVDPNSIGESTITITDLWRGIRYRVEYLSEDTRL